MGQKIQCSVAMIVVVAAVVGAAKPPSPRQTTTVVNMMLTCRSIGDPQARLACYDDKAATLSTAIADKSIVVIDKAQAHEASRSLFGFSIPNFGGLFGDGDGIKEIESTVASSSQNADGGMVLTLADGSVWSQIDDKPTIPARRGDKVRVSRGTLGSFFVSTQRSNMFKAKRVG